MLTTLKSPTTPKTNERISLIVVLLLATTITAVSVYIVYLLNIQIIFLVTGILPAVISSAYLIYSHEKKKKSLVNKSNYNKMKVPYILYIILIISWVAAIITTGVFQASKAIYYQIFSFGMIMLWINIFFNLPLAIYERFFDKVPIAPLMMQPLTVIVPAYNEEESIEYTLESIIKSDYPNKQIIVVDDGSTDETYKVASLAKLKFANNNSNISIIRKKNGGKTSAINYALRFAKGEIVTVVDADSRIDRNALKELAAHFQDTDVYAVAGNVKIWNRCNAITKCLTLELILNVNVLRPSYSLLGSVLIVPGALGAFRKKIMIERGTYDKDVLTEDFDLTVKVLKAGGTTVTSRAQSYSRVPPTMMGFYKQRTRWMRGNLQTMIKHKNILSNSSYNFQKYAYTIMLVSMFLYPTMDMIVGGLSAYGLMKGYIFPILIPFAVFILLQFLVGIMAFVMDGKERDWKIILYSPLFVVGYRHLLDLIVLESIFDVLVRKNLKWTSITHKGSADTISQIVLTFTTAPIRLIDKIFSTRLESAVITNPKSRKYSLVVFCVLFTITLGIGIITGVKFIEQGQIHFISVPTSMLSTDDIIIYDRYFVPAMRNISNLIPKNESVITSSNGGQVGYFTGHDNNIWDSTANSLYNKTSLLEFMTERNITYLVAFETIDPFETSDRGIFRPSELEGLREYSSLQGTKEYAEELGVYSTEYLGRVHVYHFGNLNRTSL
jgi:biofilm PGA synthesis N-glycosyltransferase PgaC